MSRFLPRTLFARTFFLLAALVLLTTTAWLSLFKLLDSEPRAMETAQLASSTVNLIRASLFAAAPDKRLPLFYELSTREGIRLRPAEPEDKVLPLPDNRLFRLVQQELNNRLGPHTRIAAEVDGIPGFWVSFRLDERDDEEFWLVFPRNRVDRDIARHWLLWGVLAFVLALIVAWIIASRMSLPMKALARSALAVGRGEEPPPLPDTRIEEVRQLGEAFNAMAASLKQNEEDRAIVLAGISHDLRTPLTRLRLEAEMSMADEASRQAVISDIEQMAGIITQFMDFARALEGEAALPVVLRDFLKIIVDRQEAQGFKVDWDGAENLPATLQLRPRSLERALINLIDNAWKYGANQVALHVTHQAGELVLQVDDNGPGIPDREMDRLRRPFARLEGARSNASGTGLGLAIVERVMRQHAGRLELHNRPQGGLSARLCLPLNP